MTQENEEKIGIVYVLKNEGMPGLIKIGRTDQRDHKQRMKNLYTTGVPFAFEAVKVVKVNDSLKVEKALHKAFETDRVNPNREFFRMKADRAIALLDLVKVEDITAETNRVFTEGLAPEEREAQAKAEKLQEATERELSELREGKAKRPPLNYFDLGIKENDHLFWKDDPKVFATVCADRKVIYNGHVMSLTKATQELLGKPYNVQPSPYWTYDGRLLFDIYNEKYPPELEEEEE